MKVLYVTHAFDLAGANRSMLQMILELKVNHKVEPFIVFPKSDEALVKNIRDVCEENEIPYLEHRMTNFKRKDQLLWLRRLYFVVFQFLYVLSLYLKLRKYHFDIIHTNTSVNDTGAYLSWLLRLPHVWHLREYGESDFGLKSLFGENYERMVYRKSTVFVAISKSIKNYFSSVIDSNKIRLVYNGIKPKESNLKSDHVSPVTNICIVGRVEENKNQLEALRAVHILRDRGRSLFHLYIIGRGNNIYIEELKQYIKSNKLEEYVSIMGERNDVPLLLKDMDIGLMLSTSEAFGRVTVEYMMQNLAVIASDTGANTELIVDGETGFLYPLGKVEELAEKIDFLLNDKVELQVVAHRGYTHAISNFSSNKNSDCIFDIYKDILC